MSEVKRYDPMGYDRLSGYMQQHPEGDYVRHDDYAALEAECERLRKQLAESCNSILVTEACPESRSVEEHIVDADSVRASWRLIRGYREQIEALRLQNAMFATAAANIDREREALRAEAEALRAENEAYAKNLRGKHSLAGATYELLIRERDQLRTELEAARSALAGDGRDEFEAMCRSQHRNITRDDRPDPPLAWGYANSLTHDRWCGWAAAWKRAGALVADRRTNQGGEA